MNQSAGIKREETKLQNGLKRILELREQFYSKDNILKEFKMMMMVMVKMLFYLVK